MVAVRVLNSMLTEAGSRKYPRTSISSVLLSWLWKKGDSCTRTRETVCMQTLSFCETPKHIVSPIQKQADRKREKEWQPACLGPLLPAMVHIFLAAMVHSPPDCVFAIIYIYNSSLLNLPTSSCFSITNPDHEGSSKSIWGLHATIQWGQLWFLWLLADPAPGVWEPSLNIWVALLWPPTPQSAQYHCLLLFNSH